MALSVAYVLATNSQQMTEAERQVNADRWERCVNVREGDDLVAAIASCDGLLGPRVPLTIEQRALVVAKRGVIAARRHLFALAEKDLAAAIKDISPDLRSWVMLEHGLAVSELGRQHDAIPELTVVISREPTTSDYYVRALVGRAVAYFLSSEYRRAAADLDTLISSGKSNAHLLYLRGLCKRHLGDRPAAQIDIDAAIKLDRQIEEKMKTYGVKIDK